MSLRRCLGISLFLYLHIVTVSCEEGSTLAFAIDNTYSMEDDINYVKKGAENITNLVFSKKSSAIKDMVLVKINDPRSELLTKTNNRTEFLRKVNQIHTHSKPHNDCPEMALTGIEIALTESRPESYIYAFTDSNAKDYRKLVNIKTLCQRKQSQVVIVFSKDRYCYQPRGTMFTVFYDVAKACSGQVFVVEKDQVDSVLKAIEALLQGKTSIFKWIMVPRTKLNEYVAVKFTIDEKAEYAIVSASGENVDLRVTADNNVTTPAHEWVMQEKNAKFVKLLHPSPGTYYARVKGTSDVTVVVYGRTDFTFDHGFSVMEPKSLTDTSKQPIAGLEQYLSINVTDPDNSVNIQSVQILDIKTDRVFNALPLRRVDDNLYITDAFVSPNYTFRIAVHGEIKQGHAPIVRHSPNIDPQFQKYIPDSKPVIKIKEGVRWDVNYGSDISLTCEVNAHPMPTIEWYTSSGGLPLPSNSSVVDDPTFVSYLKQENIIKEETYICKAANKKGHGTERRITIGIKPIFTVVGEAIFNAKYGEDVQIPCNIKSYLPFTVRWYRGGAQLAASPGALLTLSSVDVGMQDKYTCEATLNSDPTKKKTNYRDVKISGLVYPKVTYATTVLKGKNFKAICRVEGVPKPTISWQFKANGSEEFVTIPGSGEELNIPQLKLTDTGVYKCTAKNVLGETNHEFDVVVEEPPIIKKDEEGAYYGVEGDLVLKIPCDVTGFPVPAVIWKKEGKVIQIGSKHKVQGTTLYINKPVESDSGEYRCEATNKLGTDTKTSVVDIVEIFTDDENFNGDTHEVYVEKGTSKSIECNLKNVKEGPVRWFKDGTLTAQTGSTYTIESTSEDDGNYTCRVNTKEGSVSETYVVYFGKPPVFSSYKPSPNTVDWKTNDETLECAADSEPPATYEWSHNGKAIRAGNDLQQLTVTDWGEYTCHVSNVHGNISRTYEVVTLGCYITKVTSPENQPLVSEVNTPRWPSSIGNSDLILEKNNEIKLSCLSNKNTANAFKMIPSKQEIIAKCETQDKFSVDGRTYRYSDLGCNNKVESTVVSTREQCAGPNSEMIRVGFEVNGFLDAYKVCYNRRLHVPLHARISTNLSRNGGVVGQSKFNWSSAAELGSRKTGDWGPEGSCKCCYTKGQLVTVSETALGPAQAATFKDNLNLVPVWNPCDDSRTSWQDFESTLDDKWTTWTGASEYVRRDGVLVPRYLWKVIDSDEGSVAMVYVNGGAPTERDARCPGSACEPLGAQDPHLYCCTLADFTASFHLPPDAFTA